MYKGKGDALECGSYRGIKLPDQVMKGFESVIARKMRNLVSLDDMQFGFRPGRGSHIPSQADSRKVPDTEKRPMDSICGTGESVRQSSSRYVVVGVEVQELIVRVNQSKYEGALTSVKLGVGESVEFAVKVGVHQGSVLSPLLFIIVL